MNSYSFSDEAIKDLETICYKLAKNNPDTASQLFDSIRHSILDFGLAPP